MTPPKKVFISYPSQSYEAARLLMKKLDAEEIDVWFDEERIHAGPPVLDNIRPGIQASAGCIFVLTEHSINSHWCHAEVGAFLLNDKSVIVYRPDEKTPIPDYLQGLTFAKTDDAVVTAVKKFIPEPVKPFEPDSAKRLVNEGLARAFRIPEDDQNGRRLTRVRELIEEEARTNKRLRLIASSGFSYLHTNGQVWKTAGLGELITSGQIEIAVVLESPFSHFAMTNQINQNQWEDKQSVSALVSLLKYPNVSLRVTDFAVNCSLFMTSSAVYYDPYIWALPFPGGRTENNFWVLEFENTDKHRNCYWLLGTHFDFLRSKSIPIEDFLHRAENGKATPNGMSFYDFYLENPQVALNRYNKLNKEFSKTLNNQGKEHGNDIA
jgi:TIR domain